ncbi:MAG: hypothetical protein FWD25_07295 [Clostridia bacterium]|nr:hypothetical protein [Clostridia bacterium]
MRASLLGLPLELALQTLAECGMTPVINRLLAPKRAEQGVGQWRVVRVHEGEPITLDVCRFEMKQW